jgi:hypothetical protein
MPAEASAAHRRACARAARRSKVIGGNDLGVDLTDQQAVEEAIHALNAERLARRLTE